MRSQSFGGGGGLVSTTNQGLSSPLYMPFGVNGYSMIKQSPKFQVNINNMSTGSNINAHYYPGAQQSNMTGMMGEMNYPSPMRVKSAPS